jgi:tRNA1Val (adenine37-N6)-methyltransferase
MPEENPHFTSNYSQPAGYHFCQDSVLAPRLIADDLRLSGLPLEAVALDVCSGCGVMGFELLHALGRHCEIVQFDFLEIQNEFEPHFRANAAATKNEDLRTNWIHANYSTLLDSDQADHYDLIIANPPYFVAGEGSKSPSELNTRARFFLNGDLKELLRGIRNALKPGARAYILMKSGKEHGRDAFTSARVDLFDCRVERLADVRGTDLVRFIKE